MSRLEHPTDPPPLSQWAQSADGAAAGRRHGDTLGGRTDRVQGHASAAARIRLLHAA